MFLESQKLVSDMDSESGGGDEESSEMSGSEEEMESTTAGGMEESGQEEAGMGAESTEAGPATRKPKTSGRRAALRIVRENVDRLTKEVAAFRKSNDASAKRVEKQISALRSDISALKSVIARENTRARDKQESWNNRLWSKLSAAPKAAPKSSPAKKKSSGSQKKKSSKGKK